MKKLAILTLNDCENMSPNMRKQIADWLREQAKSLLKDGSNYANTYRARFISAPTKGEQG